jgi:hypothetical protein
MLNSEKRAYVRKQLLTSAWMGEGADSSLAPIDMLDVSIAGAAFVVKEEMSVGVTRTFHFYLPQNPKRISFLAQIMHCMPHTYLAGYRIGVRISRIDANDSALLAQYIERAYQPA